MATTTKPREVTYLGRRVKIWEVREAGAFGVREVFKQYIDDADPRNGGWKAGTTTRRKVKGNGLKNTLVELEPERAI